MNRLINYLDNKFGHRIVLKQWLWLILLWSLGFFTMMAMTYPLKWLVKSLP